MMLHGTSYTAREYMELYYSGNQTSRLLSVTEEETVFVIAVWE